jgi:hypothetical protein
MVIGYSDFIGVDNPLVIIPVAYMLVKIFRICGYFIGVTHGIVILDGE